MASHNNVNNGGSVAQIQRNEGQGPQGWKELSPQSRPPARKRRRPLLIAGSVLLLLLVLFAVLRLSSVLSATNDLLVIHVADQQAATLDLRNGSAISPTLFGTNVFPRNGSSSLDQPFSGFMPYTPKISTDLQDMHVNLMRFPGGQWGEKHMLSLDQLADFSKLLSQTNGTGMIQAHLGGPIPDAAGDPQPHDVTADLNTRANLAGRWVDYMNNDKSEQRTGAHANDPFHPVNLWSVGDEPDRQINPQTNQVYTVAEYVNAFVEFSKVMHQNDPRIKVFGPELSQFYGVGAGPFDSAGHPWMDDFLKGVGDYERQHPELPFHLLDGISLHRYQFNDAQLAPGLLLSSPSEWNYLLPPLRTLIQRDLNRDLPVAVTEINTNPQDHVPSRGTAALWWADTLGTLMNQQLTYLAFFSTAGLDRPYPLFTQDGTQETAMGRVMQLFSHMQHNVIPLGIQHEPISLYATQDTAHQTVSLLFVNKAATSQIAQITSANSAAIENPWHDLTLNLSGYSIIEVTLHRNGGAETYKYTAPANDDPTTSPLTYTVCGQQTDPLVASVPC